MNILLTNDDGISSISLQRLAARLRENHEVWILAPHKQRSACSHSITLHNAIKLKQEADKEFSCQGTPADCVLVALLGYIPVEIDFVISGINYGPNIGTDIIYSGTVAGARQAALMGKPALAASLYAYQPPYHMDHPIEFLARNITKLKAAWHKDHFININFPNTVEQNTEVAIAIPSRRIYEDCLKTYKAPDGYTYVFITGEYPQSVENKDDDYYAVMQNKIAISPVYIYPENHENWEQYRELRLWNEAE